MQKYTAWKASLWILLMVSSTAFCDEFQSEEYLAEEEKIAHEEQAPCEPVCHEPVCREPICCDMSYENGYYSEIYGGYAVGKSVGILRDYGILGFFASGSYGNRFFPFFDVKEIAIRNSTWGTSVGLGFRVSDTCLNRLWGVNGFYDYRSTHFKGFNQAGVGIESLGERWDFRANGYLPFAHRTRNGHRTVFDQYEGGYVIIGQDRFLALSGFDAEIGTYAWESCCLDIYVAAGPYYYQAKKYERFWGGKCRIDFQCRDYFTCEIKVSYDSVFKTLVQATLLIELPFDLLNCTCFQSCGCCIARKNRCMGPVQRNDAIVLDDVCCWFKNF